MSALSPAPGTRRSEPPLWEKVTPAASSPLRQLLATLPGARVYEADGGRLRAIVSREDGWHLSVSRTGAYPTWDEVADARYRFVPDRLTMVMHLPPRAQWVDFHESTFHLWELPKAATS